MIIKLSYNSSSTQFNLDGNFQTDLRAFSNQYISDEDLYTEEADKGRETEFHITLLYGIDPSEDEACLNGIKETFKTELSKPVKVTLGKISKFSNEDYDVIKVDIKDCPLLHLMSEYIRENFKNNNKYPDYHPHCTLAYVQKGTCEKLVGDSTFDGKEITLDKFKYSPVDGEKEFINLKKQAGKVLLTLGQLEELKQFLMDKLYTLQNRNEIRNIYNYDELTSWLYRNAKMKIAKIGPAQQEMQNYSGELMNTPQHQALQESEPGKTNVTNEKELTMFPKKKGSKQYEIILPNHTKALQALTLLKNLQQHKYDFQVENTKFIFTSEEEFKDVQQLFKNNDIMSLSKTSLSQPQMEPHFIKVTEDNLSQCLDYLGYRDRSDFYNKTGQTVSVIIGDWVDVTDKMNWGVVNAVNYAEIPPYENVFTKEGLFFPLSNYLYTYHNITKTGLNNLKFAINYSEYDENDNAYDAHLDRSINEEDINPEDIFSVTILRWLAENGYSHEFHMHNRNGKPALICPDDFDPQSPDTEGLIKGLSEISNPKLVSYGGENYIEFNTPTSQAKKAALSSDAKAKYEELTSEVNELFQHAGVYGWDKDSLAEYNRLKKEIDELYTNTLDKKQSSISNSDGNQVASIAVMTDGEILMGKRNDNGKWTLPGGHGKKGENPIENALRELKEETGIVATEAELTYLGQDTVDAEGKQLIIHCFLLNQKEKTDNSHDPDEEVEEWKYIDVQTGLVPQEILSNLHSNPNITLGLLGLQKLENKKSMKKQANYTTLDEVKNRDSEITDIEEIDGFTESELEKVIQNSEYFSLQDFELDQFKEALNLRKGGSQKQQIIASLDNIFDTPIKTAAKLPQEGEIWEGKSSGRQFKIKQVIIGMNGQLIYVEGEQQPYKSDEFYEYFKPLDNKTASKEEILPLYVLSRKNKYNDDIFVKEVSFDLNSLAKKAKSNKDLFVSKVAADVPIPNGLASEEFKNKLKQDVQEVVEDGTQKPIVIPDKKGIKSSSELVPGDKVKIINKDSSDFGKAGTLTDIQGRYRTERVFHVKFNDGTQKDFSGGEIEHWEVDYRANDMDSIERMGDDPSSKQYPGRVLPKTSMKKFAADYSNFINSLQSDKSPQDIETAIQKGDVNLKQAWEKFLAEKRYNEFSDPKYMSILNYLLSKKLISRGSLKFAALGEEPTPEVDPELASALPFETHEDGQVEEVVNPPIEIENLFETQKSCNIPQINPEQSSDNIINQVLTCITECYPHDLVPASIWSIATMSGISSMGKDRLIPILNGVAFKLGLSNVEWNEFYPEENNLNIEGNQINLGGNEAQPSVNESQTIQEIFNTNNYDNKAPSLFSIDRKIDERMKLFVNLEALLRESADVISSTMNNVQKSASVLHYKLSDVKSKSTNRRGEITEGNINYMIHLASTLDRRLEKQVEVLIPIRGSKVVNPTHFIYAKKEYPLQPWYVNTVMES